MARNQPQGGQAPVVQRVRIRYAKRGPLRFTSHRDFARAFERAIHRAGVPIAYSQGFTPHPKVSYASAAPTGVASEAEYLEIGLRERVDVALLARALDAALSPGLDVLDAVEATGGSLADRIDAASWAVELPGVDVETARFAVAAFVAAGEVPVERLTKQGRRTFDARGPVASLVVRDPAAESPPYGVWAGADRPTRSRESRTRSLGVPSEVAAAPCAILDLVVRQVTPTVRPDDVLSGLRVVAGLEPPSPPRATRLAQGLLTTEGEIVDPFAADRAQEAIGAPSA
jgi:radical SAM-linked protein